MRGSYKNLALLAGFCVLAVVVVWHYRGWLFPDQREVRATQVVAVQQAPPKFEVKPAPVEIKQAHMIKVKPAETPPVIITVKPLYDPIYPTTTRPPELTATVIPLGPAPPPKTAQATPVPAPPSEAPESEPEEFTQPPPQTKARMHDKDFLYFGAVWCGPCKTMKATFEDAVVKKALEKFNVRFLDVDKDPALTEKFGVTRVPSYFVVNSAGDVEKRAVGIKTGDAFINWLEGKAPFLDTFQKKSPVDVGYKPRLAYTEAVQESLRSGKTLLTWNGIDVARQFRGAVVDTHLEEPLTGFKRGLLVGVPQNGKVWTVATLPFDATADDIMRALSAGRGTRQEEPTMAHQMSHQNGACQSCGQNHGAPMMMGAPRMMSGSGWSSGSRMGGGGGGMMMRGGGGRSGGG